MPTEQADLTSVLRQLWEAGLASGPAGELDLAELRQEALARLADARTADPEAE